MKKLRFYNKEKQEKGAITLFVLLACLFFVFILTGVYLSNLNRLQVQEQEVQQIHDNYAKDIDRVEEIYEELAKSAIVTLRQEPSNGTWTKEVSLIGNAKIDEDSTATIISYIFNQQSTENGQSNWKWQTVTGSNIKELVDVTQSGITKNGTYYFWIKDSEGEVHRSNEVNVQNVDNNKPTAGTLIAKEQNEDGSEEEYDLNRSPWTDKDVKIEKVDGTDGEGETETVYTILKNGVEYEDSVTNPRKDPTTLTETGEYTVTIITTDEAGNTAEREYTIKIDKVVPVLALKHNNENGADYEQGTWTKDNLYGEITLDTSKTGKEVEKYQYSYNGVIWNDISSEIIPTSIDYTTTFPMSSDKPEWISGPVNNGTYYYEAQTDGTLKPSNGGSSGNTNKNTVAESYFEIDLTNYPEAELEITLNATISSEKNYDFGYAEITESTEAIAFDKNKNYFIKATGATTTTDYTTTITGGKKYYLHIGYYKDSSSSSKQDAFIINSISLKSEELGKEINFSNYKKEGNEVTFTLNEDIEKEIYVRAVYTDGNTSKYGNKTNIKIDKTAPVIQSASPVLLSREEAKIELKVIDKGSGLKGYYISTEQTEPTENSNWTEQTMNEFTIENLKTNTTYYLWTIDNVGNISERKDIAIGTANYIVDDKITTETIAEAIEAASDGSTIKLLGDYTDTSTVTFSKDVTFDLQSYTLTRQATITINSRNIVEITGTGKITSGTSSINTITNNGTLTITNNITIENNATSTSYAPIRNNSSSAIINIEDNVQIIGYYRGIYNYYGTLNVNGGKIEATYQSSSVYGIYNYSRSSVKTYINNGEIKGYNGIYNGSSSTLEMTGGKVVGTGAYGVAGYGTTNIYGGRIEGKTYGVYSTSSNKVTLGREEDELSTTNPAIYGASYGIYMYNETNSFNFYNGKIISNTKETAYRGELNTRTEYMPYTYFDYDTEQKYCTILTPTVGNITMEATPTEYTNGDVTVKITYPYNNDIKQYSEDGTTWQEAGQYIQEVIVTENKTIYARTLNESGIITDEEQIEITNIDKERPTVNVSPSQTNYTVTSSNGTTNITLTLKANDTGVSGLDKVQYAWVSAGEEIKYIDFESTGTTITKNNLKIGQYNLYINVTDRARNKADVVQMRYTVKYEEPVCQIGTTKYTTIQAAVEACSKTAGETQTTIEMLKSTDEEFNTYEGQNIILDLKGYIVGSSSVETSLCTNNGTLQLIDSTIEKTGKLESLNGTAILNNGTFTLGDNSTEIEYEVPTIYGKQIGIENNNIFNFYDGKIQGITPIKGNTTDTPEEYGPVSTGYENGITTIQLGIVTGYEARIEWVYYTTVQEAVNATKTYSNDHRDTVTIIKDIQLTDILQVNPNKNMILDLNGYILTITSEQNTVIENYGNLEITDSSIEQTGKINITSTNTCYGIYNASSGSIEVTGGTVSSSSSSSSYGIYNSSTGTITVTGGIVIGSSGSYSSSYGIYNKSTGTITVTGGTVSSSSEYNSYGIYNYNNGGTIEVKGGIINSEGDKSSSTGIYNRGILNMESGTIISISLFNDGAIHNDSGNVTIKGGNIVSKCENDSFGYSVYNYGIYNNSGNIFIENINIEVINKHSYYNENYAIYNRLGNIIFKNGNINCVSNRRNYGVYNENEGIIEILGGTINCISSGELCYGIYNSNTGTIRIGDNENDLEPIIYVKYEGTREYIGIGIYNEEGSLEINNGKISGDIALHGGITKIRKDYQIEKKIENDIETIYLTEKVNNKMIAEIGDAQYKTLQEAIDNIENDEKETIRIIDNFELNEPINFNKNITLDLNGKQITNYYYRIENSKDIKIIDNLGEGKIDTLNTTIGLLNLDAATIEIISGIISNTGNKDSFGIYNCKNGTIKINGGKVNNNNIKNSNYCNSYGIYNENGHIIMTNGTVSSSNEGSSYTNNYGIYNETEGIIEILGGTVSSTGKEYSYGIYNKSSNGIVKIYEGIIENDSMHNDSSAIYNNWGIVEIFGGKVSYNIGRGIYNYEGIVEVTGGTISNGSNNYTSYGIYNVSNGTVKVTGGTVSSRSNNSSYGIYNTSGTIIIGTEGDGLVLKEEPYIKGEYSGTSSNYVGYGVYNTTGKLYFYDGKLEGTTKAVYDIITEYEDNTELNYNEDETILTLSTTLTPVAQIGSTTYNTLEEAINAVGNTQTTIKLLRNVAYTKNDNVITIPNSKNIILDLNGYKISSAILGKVIENNGILEITDTSTELTGTIVTSEETTISNVDGAKLTVSGGIIENRNKYIVNNSGEFILNGGKLLNTYDDNSTGDIGICNTSTGTVTINEGSITIEDGISICNQGTGSITINAGTLTVNDGRSIYNQGRGNITINAGNIITNEGTAIYNAGTGNIEITGGKITCIRTNSALYTSYAGYGVFNNSTGTITIGEKNNETIPTTEPEIIVSGYDTTEKGYGIYNPNGTLNYYDGTIKGQTKAVYGNISEVEDLTELNISSETIDSKEYEVLTLQQTTTNVARVNGTEYDSIEKAIKACGTTESTIEILRDSDPGATVIIESNQNITIDLNGYTINNYTELQNKGTLKIKDSSSGQVGKIVGLLGIAISNTGTMELQSGSVSDSGYGIKNTGTLIINGGTISNNTYGIYTDSSGVTNILSGNITSNTYGIYNYNGTTNVSGTAITRNDYGIYNAGGTTNIKEGAEVQSNIGIYAAGGRVNIGETGTMNSSSPIVTGETYGLSVTSTGLVYMYDGQIKGKSGATQGFITYTETGYAVANKVEGEYFVDYLALAGTISTVAEVNGISYSNLQSAINSIIGEETQTIKLTNGIISDITFNIAEGQNIILDMNEKTISSDLSVTINNAGNLTIIDSTSSGVGKIGSTTGTAIVNSGTLTLGKNDGTVSQNLITIEGQTYGIQNTGELNFYDGTINGGSAVQGEVTNRATGYVIRITAVNGKERYYLST